MSMHETVEWGEMRRVEAMIQAVGPLSGRRIIDVG